MDDDERLEAYASACDERDRLRAEIDRTYKAWCGRDLMHMPLCEAIGKVVAIPRKSDIDLIAEQCDEIDRRNGVYTNSVLDRNDPSNTAHPTATCIRTGRRFVGIERDPTYFEIARKRIERELSQGLLPLDAPAPARAETGVML